jgi:hypothetical protein
LDHILSHYTDIIGDFFIYEFGIFIALLFLVF